MRRRIAWTLGLLMAAAGPALAGTFDRTPIAPDLGLTTLNRSVARAQLGRNLFADPYATVTIGTTDLYDRFPYVETRTFQVVSDPRWNRLVYGELGRSVHAFDGAGTSFGPLARPCGLAVDEQGRVYVADAGNDRVLVLQSSAEYGTITLTPLYVIGGLGDPHGVAYSDGGTPFVTGDDLLYVADTGRNRVVAFALGSEGATPAGAIGELGGGPGRFAGPMAVAVGRAGGANTSNVYIADAHTQRIVHLRHQGGRFSWVAERRHDADIVTSLDTDQWGNLFAAAPRQGTIRKFNAALEPVAELRGQVATPHGFHLPFYTVRDHRVDSVRRIGRPSAISLEAWTDDTGASQWNLGLAVDAFAVEPAAGARFSLTDRADVTLELADAASGRSLWRRPAGTLDAGAHALPLSEADLSAASAAVEPVLRLSATSSYPSGPTVVALARLAGGTAVDASRPMLLGHGGNPVRRAASIAFVLPAGARDGALRVFDAGGRMVRDLGHTFAAGPHQVIWDGTDHRGRPASSGLYFYRLDASGVALSRKLVLER